MRGRWAPPPMEGPFPLGKGPREGQRTAIGHQAPPDADENNTPKATCQPPPPAPTVCNRLQSSAAVCSRPQASAHGGRVGFYDGNISVLSLAPKFSPRNSFFFLPLVQPLWQRQPGVVALVSAVRLLVTPVPLARFGVRGRSSSRMFVSFARVRKRAALFDSWGVLKFLASDGPAPKLEVCRNFPLTKWSPPKLSVEATWGRAMSRVALSAVRTRKGPCAGGGRGGGGRGDLGPYTWGGGLASWERSRLHQKTTQNGGPPQHLRAADAHEECGAPQGRFRTKKSLSHPPSKSPAKKFSLAPMYGPRRRRGGFGEMGFRAGPFVLCSNGCWNTNFGLKWGFPPKNSPQSQNDQLGSTPRGTAGRAPAAPKPPCWHGGQGWGGGGFGKWASVPPAPAPGAIFFLPSSSSTSLALYLYPPQKHLCRLDGLPWHLLPLHCNP